MKTQLCNHGLHLKTVHKNDMLFKLGQMADYSYLVMKGSLEERSARSNVARQTMHNTRREIFPGEIGGVLALKGVGSRVKACFAAEKTHLLCINVRVYLKLAQRDPSFRKRFALLRKVDALSAYDANRAYSLTFSFSEKRPTKGTVITDIGQTPVGLHIVMSGRVEVYVIDSGNDEVSKNARTRLVSCLGEGEIFDSVGILSAVAKIKRNHPGSRSTVQYVVQSHDCCLLELSPSNYNLILESPNTVDKLYRLECNRSIVYHTSVKGWRSAILYANRSDETTTGRCTEEARSLSNSTQKAHEEGTSTHTNESRPMSPIERLVRTSRSNSLDSQKSEAPNLLKQGDQLRRLGRPSPGLRPLTKTLSSANCKGTITTFGNNEHEEQRRAGGAR